MYSKLILENVNENLFITSDPQYGSKGVFEHVPSRRLFGSMAKFQQTLVNNWNAVIGENDCVLCLGDFTQNLKSRKKSRVLVEKYTGLLNGRKFLIRGNHDAEDISWYYDCGWNCLIEYPLIVRNNTLSWMAAPTPFCGCLICDMHGYRIMFSHFAIHEDDYDDRRYPVEKAFLRDVFERHSCDLNIHGHTHNREIPHPQCLSACVEQTLFSPVGMTEFMSQHVELEERKTA